MMKMPFWREDMSPDEYNIERMYFDLKWEEYKKGEYIPLWKQKGIPDNKTARSQFVELMSLDVLESYNRLEEIVGLNNA